MDANKLNETILDFEKSVSKVRTLREINEKLDDNNKELTRILSDMRMVVERQNESEKSFNKNFKAFTDEIANLMKKVADQQREYQLQLDSKLERIASDILVEIRDNRKRVEEQIDMEFGKLSNQIRENKERSDKLHKKQMMLTILVLGGTVISILFSAAGSLFFSV